jgi:hypothetical protein
MGIGRDLEIKHLEFNHPLIASHLHIPSSYTKTCLQLLNIIAFKNRARRDFSSPAFCDIIEKIAFYPVSV